MTRERRLFWWKIALAVLLGGAAGLLLHVLLPGRPPLVVFERRAVPISLDAGASLQSLRECYGLRLGTVATEAESFRTSRFTDVRGFKDAACPLIEPLFALNDVTMTLEKERMVLAMRILRANREHPSGALEACSALEAENFHWDTVRGLTNAVLLNLLPAWQEMGTVEQKQRMVDRVASQRDSDWLSLAAGLRAAATRFNPKGDQARCP